MPEYATHATYQLLLANVHAAGWVVRQQQQTDDQTLLNKFFALHEHILKSMNRPREGLFDHIDPTFMAAVVRGWMKMYTAALDDLRTQHPRTNHSTDLQAAGVNWSQKLGITYQGLLRIGSPSRYAEFWAERSLKDRDIYDSFDARMKFIGTPPYRDIADLIQDDQLLVLDDAPNAIPSYDLLLTAAAAPNPDQYLQAFQNAGWHVQKLTPTAIQTLETHTLAQ